LINSCFVFVRFPLALSEDSVCGLIGAGMAASCLRSVIPREGTGGFCPWGASLRWGKLFAGPSSSPLQWLRGRARHRNKQESVANPYPALLASSHPQPNEQRHPGKPCSPPNWFQQFPCLPLTPSACLGLPPQLHPHLHGPQSPSGGFFPASPLPLLFPV